MVRAVATGNRTGGDSGDDDSVRTFAEVNLDAKEGAQAIERHEDRPLTVDQEGDGERPQEREWLDRDKAVRKRMGRLTRNFDQRMAESEARHQRELRELRSRVDAVGARKESVQVPSEAVHEAKMAELQTKLEQAIEQGESKVAAALTREMQQAEAKYWAEKRAAASPTTETRTASKERTEESSSVNTPNAGLPKVAKRWINAQDWWDDPDFKIERQAAVILDEELLADGSNPEKKSHYRKLAKQLKRKFPGLDIEMPWGQESEELSGPDEDEDEDDDSVRPVRQEKEVRNARPAVPGFGDRGQIPATQRRVAAGGRKVVLSQEDRAAMARFKMDPDDDKDVANWARSKEETDRAYGGRG